MHQRTRRDRVLPVHEWTQLGDQFLGGDDHRAVDLEQIEEDRPTVIAALKADREGRRRDGCLLYCEPYRRVSPDEFLGSYESLFES